MVANQGLNGQADLVAIDIEAIPELSVAMVESSMPFVARISLTNTSDAALSNLTVEINTVELPLDRDRLVNQLERSRAELMLWIRHGAGDMPMALLAKRGRAPRDGDKVVLA
jgi:hypothetical protein